MKNIWHNNSGFISLTLVLVVLGALMAVTLAVGLRGISEVQSGLYGNQGNRVLQVAEACSEEAYLRLKLDSSYVGGIIDVNGDGCEVSVAGAGATRTITATATRKGFTREVVSTVYLNENVAGTAKGIDLTKWE